MCSTTKKIITFMTLVGILVASVGVASAGEKKNKRSGFH